MSTPSTPPNPPAIESTLSQAAAGLSYTSETDAPLVPFFWPGAGESPTAEALARWLALPADAAIEQQSLDEFLEPVAAEEDWQEEEERAMGRRFQALGGTLRGCLREVSVFRVGEVSVDVYIVGAADGGLAGLQTRVVET